MKEKLRMLSNTREFHICMLIVIIIAILFTAGIIVLKYNISYGDNFFPSKTYKGIKYPAGYYNSLVITLGQGLGENFWCVMYPPLCLIDENKNTTEVEYKSYVKDVLLKYN